MRQGARILVRRSCCPSADPCSRASLEHTLPPGCRSSAPSSAAVCGDSLSVLFRWGQQNPEASAQRRQGQQRRFYVVCGGCRGGGACGRTIARARRAPRACGLGTGRRTCTCAYRRTREHAHRGRPRSRVACSLFARPARVRSLTCEQQKGLYNTNTTAADAGRLSTITITIVFAWSFGAPYC